MQACGHWPVIVSSVDRLPQSVAAGGSLHCGGDNAFPLRLCEASRNGRPEFALPVMALGTQVGLPSGVLLPVSFAFSAPLQPAYSIPCISAWAREGRHVSFSDLGRVLVSLWLLLLCAVP